MTYRRKNPVRRHTSSKQSIPFALNQNNAIVHSVMHHYALLYTQGTLRSVRRGHDLVLRELHNINTAPCANNGPMPTMGTILRTPCYSTFLRLVRSMECEIQASRLANIHRAFPQSVREAR
ncbi:hypothetical protein [Sphingobium limneticum]|uniref:Uncharacterized protein n=1 Tax=Sphingobium limneticum TaxID=1007511 RepID=A0A5J5I6Q3_9SPHN|nr:hypothetical protein [Sphingobium limneticum]KAA9019639.1 hypothetical protein F4U96_05150 [Sphingobium limneticum]KAA9032096.1 hypothetical protein F4U95_05150 [Sphingobium limneticum]